MNKKFARAGIAFASLWVCSFSILQKEQNLIHTAVLNNDSLPVLPYTPGIKTGWIGQYVCKKVSNSTGSNPSPFKYYHEYSKMHSGFIELSNKINYPIKVNMPDSKNTGRWESWISQGKSKSWNQIKDSLHEITVITSDVCCRTPHNHYYTVSAGNERNLTIGDASSSDLQIDWETGTFIFTLPTVSYKAKTWEQWNVYGKKLNNYIREKEESVDAQEFSRVKLGLNEMDTIMGKISRNQRTILIERKIAHTLKNYLWHSNTGKEVFITPHATEEVVFVVTLNRIGD